ncbi:hypothetical protein KJ605_01190 [Patescibacteria group bacterium]|nr:hypothetical protein [Patescibacteria group bacterium]MBU1970374.1 hypothetical protein [Patescibacteria group bacterium]
MNVVSNRIASAKLFKAGYLLFLVLGFFYVRGVLDTDSFKVSERGSDKPVEKVRELSIKLAVITESGQKDYQTTLKNTDSVKDLLEKLRQDQALMYEVDLYTYGLEIYSVLGKTAEQDKKWAILLEGQDITNKINEERLMEDGMYVLKQITRNAEQQ